MLKINIAPTNRAKRDREEAVQRALWVGGEEGLRGGAPLGGPALEYSIPETMLYNHPRGMASRQKLMKTVKSYAPAWRMRFCNGLAN